MPPRASRRRARSATRFSALPPSTSRRSRRLCRARAEHLASVAASSVAACRSTSTRRRRARAPRRASAARRRRRRRVTAPPRATRRAEPRSRAGELERPGADARHPGSSRAPCSSTAAMRCCSEVHALVDHRAGTCEHAALLRRPIATQRATSTRNLRRAWPLGHARLSKRSSLAHHRRRGEPPRPAAPREPRWRRRRRAPAATARERRPRRPNHSHAASSTGRAAPRRCARPAAKRRPPRTRAVRASPPRPLTAAESGFSAAAAVAPSTARSAEGR